MQIDKPKGRKVEPDILAKYEKIRAILLERPNTFSKRDLCRKHETNYHNFCQWLRNKEAPKEHNRSSVFMTDTSLIITTVESLTNLAMAQIKESIKVTLYEGIKANKIKLLKL